MEEDNHEKKYSNATEAQALGMNNRFDLFGFVRFVWNSSTKILLFTVGIGLIGVALAYILPSRYKSTAVVLPETDRSKLSALGGLSDLASIAGIGLPGESSLAKLYPAIIRSEAILKTVIYASYTSQDRPGPINLIQFYKISEKTPEESYEALLTSFREELDVTLDNKTGLLTISLITKDAEISAEIVNNIVAELDKFIRTKRKTSASEQRKLIETRLEEVRADLGRSEDALRDFRIRNRQVGSSPDLLLQQERLGREVQINSTLFIELKKQYELIKIEEIKNIPIINLLDAAHPAAFRDSPKRKLIVLAFIVLGFLAALTYLFVRFHYLEQIGTLLVKIRSYDWNKK